MNIQAINQQVNQGLTMGTFNKQGLTFLTGKETFPLYMKALRSSSMKGYFTKPKTTINFKEQIFTISLQYQGDAVYESKD